MNYIAPHDAPGTYITSSSSSFDSSRSAHGIRVEYPKMTVVALGGFGGRVDQSFHSVSSPILRLTCQVAYSIQIHALHTAQQGPGLPRKVFLISEQNITFLLQRGANVLYMPRAFLGPCCGIIPVGTPAIITTKGFEWNLTEAETKFGGMVSTSNHIVRDEVSVETTEPIVFTIEFRENKKAM
jgi:thiamine pyrophosphokinase